MSSLPRLDIACMDGHAITRGAVLLLNLVSQGVCFGQALLTAVLVKMLPASMPARKLRKVMAVVAGASADLLVNLLRTAYTRLRWSGPVERREGRRKRR